jgi:hypothetical protein
MEEEHALQIGTLKRVSQQLVTRIDDDLVAATDC